MGRSATARVALAIGLAASGCAARTPERPQVVVLVTVDTLRADHVGAYGYPRATTPFLDELAERGAVFDRALSTSATTGPAHASLFTGQLPLAHGVRSNHQRLSDSLPTLAERMAAAGYETAAFVGVNTHFAQSGLDRGFVTFDRPHSRGEMRVRSAPETAQRVHAWLAARPPAPLFLWVHFFDPHVPYRARPYRSTDAERHARFLREEQRVDLAFFGGSERNLLALMDAYDGEVVRVDAALRALHASVVDAHPGMRVLWIVTSDHGEGLGNHHWLMHGAHIYNEQLRVPLVVVDGAGALRTGRVDALVSHVDLAPTLVELLGLSWPADAGALAGRSYAALLGGDGEPPPRRRAVFSERRHFKAGPTPPSEIAPARPRTPVRFSLEGLIEEAYRTSHDPGEKYALQDGRYKYILHSVYGDELYDLARDPYEQENLVGRGLPQERELREALVRRLRELKKRTPPALQIGRESLEALRELGYVE